MTIKLLLDVDQIPPKDMKENDRMCGKCFEKDIGSHEIQEQEKELIKESSGHLSVNSPMGDSNTITSKSKPMTSTSNLPSAEITSVDELTKIVDLRHNEFKRVWQKGRVVQFKNDKIAILMRAHASQVQFIVAYDQVTREGFRLMAIDEGKEGSIGGITGGVTSYYYFQKIEYVR